MTGVGGRKPFPVATVVKQFARKTQKASKERKNLKNTEMESRKLITDKHAGPEAGAPRSRRIKRCRNCYAAATGASRTVALRPKAAGSGVPALPSTFTFLAAISGPDRSLKIT